MDLPGLDGYDVCSRLRSENDQVPILAIFNGEGELKASFMQSLDADDYLVKPFNPRELVARVRVILHPQKRTLKHPSTALCFGSLTLDLARGVFKVKERVVPMRRLDQDLLACLLNNVGRYTSQADLMDGGWGTDDLYQTLSIDAHMARLQSLLRGSGARITSDPQAGYKLEKQEISMRSKPLD
jgi:DNA-binding response OmpR family regulator